MAISIFDMYTIGIGPSSSHTVGPMRAANQFRNDLGSQIQNCTGLKVELFGSLGLTGKGHGSDKAVLLGLMGLTPETVNIDGISQILTDIKTKGKIQILKTQEIAFDYKNDLIFHRKKKLIWGLLNLLE